MKSNRKEIVRAALIAAEDTFRAAVHEAVEATDGRVDVGLETDATPDALLREPDTPLSEYDPQILFMHLGPTPEDGIRLAGTLSRAHPGIGIIVSGAELSQAQLLEAMRAGISEVVGHKAGPEDIGDSLDRLLRKLGLGGEGVQRRSVGKVLTFFSPKGGTGCSTVSMNIGIELHRLTGKRTLLVDLDLELGEIASFMGLKPRFHLVDLLKNFHRMDEDLLTSYIERHESGVHVLSAPFEPETGQNVGADEIASVVSFLRRQYDYVVIDTSKSLAPPALAAMRPADELFLVTNLDLCSLRNFKRCMPIFKDITGEKGERIRLIVNRYAKNALVSLDDLETTVGLPVFGTLTNDFYTVIESLSTGRPLVLQSNARYAQEIRTLAARIAGQDHEIRPKRGLVFGRLFGARSANGARRVESKEALNHA
jgi:pilus assembly protein CpaE